MCLRLGRVCVCVCVMAALFSLTAGCVGEKAMRNREAWGCGIPPLRGLMKPKIPMS